ncbi:polysaccharide deacetylase family protein [Virgibacillus byunsanensis]|uniref:Polysaccharide deacetylase family protein n=1 Tax=Virgibacillus byunsanensis TaxID=570945 RepID=A0ABW3LL33_9BACI
MKKYFWLLIVLIFFTACGSNESTEEIEKENVNSSDQTEDELQEENGDSQQTDDEDQNEEPEEYTEEETIEARYKVNENATVVPLNDEINEEVVLLTIDDAPDTYGLEMAKTLKNLDVNAIFFVNGHFIDTPEEEEALQEIYDMGFAIGNHTFSHKNLKNISQTEQTEEIVHLNDRIEEIIGERPLFFRAPHGVNTDHSNQVAGEEGMVVMNWTYGYDYFEPYMDVDKLTEAMITGEGPEVDVPYSLLKPGANLLMHAREWTAEALEDIVVGLQNKGYEMVDPNLIETK